MRILVGITVVVILGILLAPMAATAGRFVAGKLRGLWKR